ncbi:hypothetical protein [Acanthamoeba polyphaga mimivirus]|uniref:Uncharacterized protein n=1 Tax=Acanthamoeba polyphaga mimivirus TaxID=212035 RepID=A0A2L2DIV8_MIMIV|nr:hypothetical protein [Acanthamoeba polyphaga mimivirus]
MQSIYFINKKKYIAKNVDDLYIIDKLDINSPFNFHGCMDFYGLLHNNKKLMIETTNITLTRNIFIDSNFGIKILFDKKQSVLVKLYKHFKKMDEFFGSDNFQKNFSSSKKLSYEPIVKKKIDEQDEDENEYVDEIGIERYYFKCKLKTSDNKNEEIKSLTHILNNGIFCKSTLSDNKSKYKGYHLHLNNNKYSCLTENSKIKLIFYYDYVWVNSYKYGIGLKIDLMDINNENPKIYTNQYANQKFNLDFKPKITLHNQTIIEI